MAAHLARLTGDLGKGSGGAIPHGWSFTVMEGKNFFPADVSPRGSRKAVAGPALKKAGRDNEEPYWSFRWQDQPPARIGLHDPLVSVETTDDLENWRPLLTGAIPVDDSGYDIAIICTKSKTGDGMGVYEARWYNPVPGDGKLYRFKISPRGGQAALYSPAFR